MIATSTLKLLKVLFDALAIRIRKHLEQMLLPASEIPHGAMETLEGLLYTIFSGKVTKERVSVNSLNP